MKLVLAPGFYDNLAKLAKQLTEGLTTAAKKHGIVLGMAVLGAFMTGLNIGLAADEISKSEHWRTAYAAAARGDWRGVLKALMGAPDGHFLGEHLFGDFAREILKQAPWLKEQLNRLWHDLYEKLNNDAIEYNAELERRFGPAEAPPPGESGPPMSITPPGLPRRPE